MKMNNLIQETHDEAIDRIIANHLPDSVMSRLTSSEQKAIRDCISHARQDGAVAAAKEEFMQSIMSHKPHRPGYPRPLTPIDEEIAKQAIEFEKQQAPKFLARIDSDKYPWRWCYASFEIQKQFCDFCKSKEAKSKNT